ncbi:hypothetical protein T440DRAFT_417818 [Plenodomus tracheiphilus IPT5]|uniref:Uncharacterized protein n=1 Tax=Plenodomus tracheiphilus IPT5 TaxID=1408161 RepID=A0A6A7BGG8_9PLEO|nr:hypothetical protein T440DRAFT_417818 [Plenodomus tracheiphilus IPT5]
MAGFIQNILWNSVEGFVEAGTRSAGEYAGNALIKAGDMIENGGRGVGNSIEKKATNYGSSIIGQTYQPSPKALPSTARKPVVKRSNSLPASSKLVNSGTKAITSTPLGAKKYPGTNTTTAKKAVTGGVYRAKSTTSGVTSGANKSINGLSTSIASGGQKALTSTPSTFKTPSSTSSPTKNLPKPYPGVNSTLPKPNAFPSSSSYSGAAGPKTAVKSGGTPKPFVPPVEQKKINDSKTKPKPYPGTNTLPGQASKTPVTTATAAAQKLKPLPRLGPQVGAGQKMQHISV